MHTDNGFLGAGMTRTLRMLLLIDLVLFSASSVVTFFDYKLVAESLSSQAGIGDDLIPAIIIAAILQVVSIASVAGLWTKTRRWARNLYTCIPLLVILLTPIAGDVVKSGVLDTIDIVNWIATGAVLLLIWVIRTPDPAVEKRPVLASVTP